MTSTKRMLLSFAHPDDESFGMGGAIAKYVDEGVDVYLICSTNGDVGTIPEAMRDQYATVAELRLAELDCASAVLGFKDVFKLSYKDSGMVGSDTTKDTESSWYVWENEPERLIYDVTKIIRQVRPQVVVTFNKYGGYGHPDHIAIQRATEIAFHRANDADYPTEGLAPYQPQKLYYTGIPAMLVRIGIWNIRLQLKNPRKVGTNKDIDLVKILDHVDPSHTKVDITKYVEKWDEANACHASQGGGRRGFVPKWLRQLIGTQQGFTRVYPQPKVNRIDEKDLFDGVTLSS